MDVNLTQSDLFERSCTTPWHGNVVFPHPGGKFGAPSTGSASKTPSSQAAASSASAPGQPAKNKQKKPSTSPAAASTKPQTSAPATSATPRATVELRICCRGLCHEWGLALKATKNHPAGVPGACPADCSYKHLSQLPAGTTKASVAAQVKRTVEKLLEPDQVRVFLDRIQSDPRLA